VRQTAIVSMVLLQGVAAFMPPLPPAHGLAGRNSGEAMGKQQQLLFGGRPPLPAVQACGTRARPSKAATLVFASTAGDGPSKGKAQTNLAAIVWKGVRTFLEGLRDVYGQVMVFFFDTLINRPFLNILNKVVITDHERLTDAISRRKWGQPLITVSNHQSSMDEPLLFSAIIPWPIKQWQLRYSLCNDNMFYSLGPIFAQLFFYAARGLPIWRSRSMDQPSFREFCDKAERGGWCHIFPEGRLWQPWKLKKEGRLIGNLKPGVGKLIAHCETSKYPPIVLPFHHTGMHRIYPQFPNSQRQSLPPKTGNTLRVRVGQPIPVQDLIDESRESRRKAREELGSDDGWKTTPADTELYNKITARIEEHLTRLASEVDKGVEWQTHPSVLKPGQKDPVVD